MLLIVFEKLVLQNQVWVKWTKRETRRIFDTSSYLGIDPNLSHDRVFDLKFYK